MDDRKWLNAAIENQWVRQMYKFINYLILLAGALCILSLLSMAMGFYEFTLSRLIVDICGIFVLITAEVDKRKKNRST